MKRLRLPSRRLSAGLAALALCVSLTAGCGFRPIYAQSTGVTAKLSNVDVNTGEGRSAYLLRQSVIENFGAYDVEIPDYELRMEVLESRRGFGITEVDVASRYEVLLNVNYVLIRKSDARVLDRGRVTGAASYDVPFDRQLGEDPYATIAVEENAKERAADLAAQRLRSILTVTLAGGA